MNYINRGKRDILIFPNFDNVEKIQEIRKKFDELYDLIPPHITIAFPFNSEISNEELKRMLEKSLIDVKPFKIKCKGVSIKKDKKVNTFYIFLNILYSADIIKEINQKIYKDVLNKDILTDYVPHITLGNIDIDKTIIKLDDEFETVVDNIVVESIGKNEESIIEFNINL